MTKLITTTLIITIVVSFLLLLLVVLVSTTTNNNFIQAQQEESTTPPTTTPPNYRFIKCGPPGTNPVVEDFTAVAILPRTTDPDYDSSVVCDIHFAEGSKFQRLTSEWDSRSIRTLVIKNVEFKYHCSECRQDESAVPHFIMNLKQFIAEPTSTKENPSTILLEGLKVTLTNFIVNSQLYATVWGTHLDFQVSVASLPLSQQGYLSTVTIKNCVFDTSVVKDIRPSTEVAATVAVGIGSPATVGHQFIRESLTIENNEFISNTRHLSITLKMTDGKSSNHHNNNNNNNNEKVDKYAVMSSSVDHLITSPSYFDSVMTTTTATSSGSTNQKKNNNLIMIQNNKFKIDQPLSLCHELPESNANYALRPIDCLRIYGITIYHCFVDTFVYQYNDYLSNNIATTPEEGLFLHFSEFANVVVRHSRIELRYEDLPAKFQSFIVGGPFIVDAVNLKTSNVTNLLLIDNNNIIIDNAIYINVIRLAELRCPTVIIRNNYLVGNARNDDARYSTAVAVGEWTGGSNEDDRSEEVLNASSFTSDRGKAVDFFVVVNNSGSAVATRRLPIRFPFFPVSHIVLNIFAAAVQIGATFFTGTIVARNTFTIDISGPENSICVSLAVSIINTLPQNLVKAIRFDENRFTFLGKTHILQGLSIASRNTPTSIATVSMCKNFMDARNIESMLPIIYKTGGDVLKSLLPGETRVSFLACIGLRMNHRVGNFSNNECLMESSKNDRTLAFCLWVNFEASNAIRQVLFENNVFTVSLNKELQVLKIDEQLDKWREYSSGFTGFVLLGPTGSISSSGGSNNNTNNNNNNDNIEYVNLHNNTVSLRGGSMFFSSMCALPARSLSIQENDITAIAIHPRFSQNVAVGTVIVTSGIDGGKAMNNYLVAYDNSLDYSTAKFMLATLNATHLPRTAISTTIIKNNRVTEKNIAWSTSLYCVNAYRYSSSSSLTVNDNDYEMFDCFSERIEVVSNTFIVDNKDQLEMMLSWPSPSSSSSSSPFSVPAQGKPALFFSMFENQNKLRQTTKTMLDTSSSSTPNIKNFVATFSQNVITADVLTDVNLILLRSSPSRSSSSSSSRSISSSSSSSSLQERKQININANRISVQNLKNSFNAFALVPVENDFPDSSTTVVSDITLDQRENQFDCRFIETKENQQQTVAAVTTFASVDSVFPAPAPSRINLLVHGNSLITTALVDNSSSSSASSSSSFLRLPSLGHQQQQQQFSSSSSSTFFFVNISRDPTCNKISSSSKTSSSARILSLSLLSRYFEANNESDQNQASPSSHQKTIEFLATDCEIQPGQTKTEYEAPKPPQPPLERNLAQVVADATQATSMTLIAAASPVVPSMSFSIAKQQATLNFLQGAKDGDCSGLVGKVDENGNALPPAMADSPTQMSIGSSSASYLVGGVVGNFVLSVGILLFVQSLGHVYLKVTGSKSFAKPYSVFARCHVSLVFFIVSSMLLAPTLTFGLTVISMSETKVVSEEDVDPEVVETGPSMILRVVALFIALVLFLVPTMYYSIWILYLRKDQQEQYRILRKDKDDEKEDDKKKSKSKNNDEKNKNTSNSNSNNKKTAEDSSSSSSGNNNILTSIIDYWFTGPGEWQLPRKNISEKQLLDFDVALPLLDGYNHRAKWFGLVEYIVQIGLAFSAMLAQVVPRDVSCLAEGISLCLILGLFVALCIYYRPFQEKFCIIVLPAAALLNMIIVILVLVFIGRMPSWIDDVAMATASLQSVVAIVVLLASLGPLLKPVLRVVRRLRRLIRSRKDNNSNKNSSKNFHPSVQDHRHAEHALRHLMREENSDDDNNNEDEMLTNRKNNSSRSYNSRNDHRDRHYHNNIDNKKKREERERTNGSRKNRDLYHRERGRDNRDRNHYQPRDMELSSSSNRTSRHRDHYNNNSPRPDYENRSRNYSHNDRSREYTSSSNRNNYNSSSKPSARHHQNDDDDDEDHQSLLFGTTPQQKSISPSTMTPSTQSLRTTTKSSGGTATTSGKTPLSMTPSSQSLRVTKSGGGGKTPSNKEDLLEYFPNTKDRDHRHHQKNSNKPKHHHPHSGQSPSASPFTLDSEFSFPALEQGKKKKQKKQSKRDDDDDDFFGSRSTGPEKLMKVRRDSII